MSVIHFLKRSGLIRDNITFFASCMLLNIIGFVYHAYIGRILGPAQYGILGVMLSILYLLNVIFNVIQTSITRFVSGFKARNDFGSIHYLLSHGLNLFLKLSAMSTVAYLVIGIFLADFLHIPYSIYAIFAIVIPFVYLLPLNRGLLQGLQRFKGLGLNQIAEGFFKLAVGISLVVFGWGVGGAVFGLAFSYVGAYTVSFFHLKDVYHYPKKRVGRNNISKYCLPVLFTLLTLTALYTADVLLVKHYFSEYDAGIYAAASLISKIVLFASISIVMVMFPKVSEHFDKKSFKDARRVLNVSLLMIFLMSSGVFLFYIFFPNLVILLLFGEQFLDMTNILWPFALAYGLFSLINSLSMYNLSVHRYSFIWFVFVADILEVMLIWLFHNSLLQVLLMFAISLFVLLLFLLGYTYFYKLENKSLATYEV